MNFEIPRLDDLPPDALISHAPTVNSLNALVSDVKSTEEYKRAALTKAYLQAVSSNDSDLLEWLLLNSQTRHYIDLNAKWDEASPGLVLCVVFSHSDCARILVEAGVDINAVDNVGWTALMHACYQSNTPLASYFLNHGADTEVVSHKGLKAVDLARGAKDAAILRDMILAVQEVRSPELNFISVAAEKDRKALRKDYQKQLDLADESVRTLNIQLDTLCLKPEPSPMLDNDTNGFEWTSCEPDQMLVFSHEDLPIIFSLIIDVDPIRSRAQRVIPANVLFLSARFAAHYSGSNDLLNALLDGAIDEIEARVHAKADDMATIAFWLYNVTLLLYFLRSDPVLDQMSEYNQAQLTGLLNELFVFIIRDAEKRIDKILDAAMLDYESLSGFEDVRFEGEWNILKSLTGHRRKESKNSVMSLFGVPENAPSSPRQRSVTAGSPSQKPRKLQRQSMANLRSPEMEEEISPRHITSILSSTLFVLQLYEIHPCVVVQAFSQIFYWLACECFNRILTRKKYLARSKAIQIRLNASALEDWARLSFLPPKILSEHFKPLHQLLQWLQCLSTPNQTLDELVGTMQVLHTLNPPMLRRAVNGYRFEVEEGRMSEECAQYMLMVEQDYERHRVAKAVEEAQTEAEPESQDEMDEEAEMEAYYQSKEYRQMQEAVKEIDATFTLPESYSLFTPPHGPPCSGELLNSRYMLPFALPSSTEDLLVKTRVHSFGQLAQPKNGLRPESPLLSNQALALPVPTLPDGFLERLDAERAKVLPEPRGTSVGLGMDEHADIMVFDWRKKMAEELGEDSEEE